MNQHIFYLTKIIIFNQLIITSLVFSSSKIITQHYRLITDNPPLHKNKVFISVI